MLEKAPYIAEHGNKEWVTLNFADNVTGSTYRTFITTQADIIALYDKWDAGNKNRYYFKSKKDKSVAELCNAMKAIYSLSQTVKGKERYTIDTTKTTGDTIYGDKCGNFQAFIKVPFSKAKLEEKQQATQIEKDTEKARQETLTTKAKNDKLATALTTSKAAKYVVAAVATAILAGAILIIKRSKKG